MDFLNNQPVRTQEHEAILRRATDLRQTCGSTPEISARTLSALCADFESAAEPLRRRILATSLEWGEGEADAAAWLHRTSDQLSLAGYRTATALVEAAPAASEAILEAFALALFYMGEVVKWDVVVTSAVANDQGKPHRLMREAMARRVHRAPLALRVDGRRAHCTIESLYLRVLLLARFASGMLNTKQIEILDAWMWQWMPVLHGVSEPPEGAALRADLDSTEGLKRGPRPDAGPSLYLPQGPIEAAHRAVLAEFHAGRIVPSEGRCADLRVEEHVRVLDIIRIGLKESRKAPVMRAVRHDCDRTVELVIGLTEIDEGVFMPNREPPKAPSLSLVSGTRSGATSRRENDEGLQPVYGRRKRQVMLRNVSQTGLGLEGTQADCGNLAAGDLVVVRMGANHAPVVGRVARCVPGRAPGVVVVGVQRLSDELHLVEASREGEGKMQLLFAPGDDGAGREDAFVVSERTFAARGAYRVRLHGNEFTLRLNRARERGRGWVLAGFEVTSARPVSEAALG